MPVTSIPSHEVNPVFECMSEAVSVARSLMSTSVRSASEPISREPLLGNCPNGRAEFSEQKLY